MRGAAAAFGGMAALLPISTTYATSNTSATAQACQCRIPQSAITVPEMAQDGPVRIWRGL